MTTETEELMAYGVQVSCFPPLAGEVVQRMMDAGFVRYTGVERYHHELSELGFVFREPVARGSSPPMPSLPAGATPSTRYVPIITALVGSLPQRNWGGVYMAGLCGTNHELDENGRTRCFSCFKIALESGRFVG